MKKYFTLLSALILTSHVTFGEIRNGYEKEIEGARSSLRALHILQMDQTLNSVERKKVKSKIETLVNFISYYELTESLLDEFKVVSPDLYHHVNTIKDGRGRSTDVFVKFIPQEQTTVNAAGITRVAQSEQDKHLCTSEYGDGTISVEIWVFNHSLHALSHELGHISYMTPNFANYWEYYKKNYRTSDGANTMGHAPDDMSGKRAHSFEQNFQKAYVAYLRNLDHRTKSPISLFQQIQKQIQSESLTIDPVASL